MKKLKSDPVQKKIMQTKDDFVSNDNFDREEAIEAALEKRKFLFKRLLKDYTFTDSDQWRGGRGGQGAMAPPATVSRRAPKC